MGSILRAKIINMMIDFSISKKALRKMEIKAKTNLRLKNQHKPGQKELLNNQIQSNKTSKRTNTRNNPNRQQRSKIYHQTTTLQISRAIIWKLKQIVSIMMTKVHMMSRANQRANKIRREETERRSKWIMLISWITSWKTYKHLRMKLS